MGVPKRSAKMKNLLILMLLIISSTARAEWNPGFYGGRGENSKFNLLWKDIASADHDIEYMGNDELSIGLGMKFNKRKIHI